MLRSSRFLHRDTIVRNNLFNSFNEINILIIMLHFNKLDIFIIVRSRESLLMNYFIDKLIR